MKKIALLVLIGLFYACSGSNDETAQPDPTDDTGDDTSGDDGAGSLTIDFDIAIMARDANFNYYQIEIENGTNSLPVEEILQGIDDNSSFARRLEGDTYMLYSLFNNPDYKVGTHNILTGVENTFIDFIDPGLPKMAHAILPGRDHITTFYSQPDGNNQLNEYFNLFTIADGSYEQVLITNETLSLAPDIRNGWLITSYVNDQAQIFLSVHNLNNTAERYTIGPVNEYLPITQANGKIYMFGNNKYRIFDLSTGVWGNDISTTDFVRANTIFPSSIVGNKMYYEALNVQPNAFISSPAIFDFNSGLNTVFDVGQFQADWWIASGNQILEYQATAFKEDDEIIVLAFSYRTATNDDKFGVLFISFDFEVVSFLEIPHLPLEVVIK